MMVSAVIKFASSGGLSKVFMTNAWSRGEYISERLSVAHTDAALFMDIVAGYHPSDPMSIPRPVPSYQAAMRNNSGKLKVLYTADLGFVSYVDPKILEHSRKSAEVFAQSMGHEVTFKDKGEAEGMLPDLYGAWGIAMGAQERVMLHEKIKRVLTLAIGNGVTAFERRRFEEYGTWDSRGLGGIEGSEGFQSCQHLSRRLASEPRD